MPATNGNPSAEEGGRQRLAKILWRLAIMCVVAAAILFIPPLMVYWPIDRLDIVWAYMTLDQRPTYWYQYCVPLAFLLAVAGALLLMFSRPLARLFRSFVSEGD